VPAYNLPGIAELNFTPEALVGICLGRIANWDDQLLRDANPKANLPHQPIVVVHRSEGSGTTYVWSDYLSKISETWKSRVGKGFSVNWPVGLSARGNDGMAALISKTPCALGYVELSYALQKHLTYGRVRNSSGTFVKADLAGVAAAAGAVAINGQEDFRFSITNPAGKDAYPISSFSWLLIPARIQDANKRNTIVDFLRWALTDGQNITQELAYGRLPAQIASRELSVVASIQ
jgi:phosphate transport system substrate-binding protein